MLKELIGLAGVPLVVALTQLVKALAPELPARFHPLVALAWALALNLLLARAMDLPWPEMVVEGVIAGLAAAGLYSAGKAVSGR